MPSYMYVWPNGDVSLVSAKTKAAAVLLLDQEDSPEESKLEPRDFAVHLKADIAKDLHFQGLDEETGLELYKLGYMSEPDDEVRSGKPVPESTR